MTILYIWRFKNDKQIYNTFVNTERELNDYLYKTYKCSLEDIEIINCELTMF